MARGRLTIGKLPHRIGPVEIERLGSLFALRCPHDLDPLMRAAGGIWEPASQRAAEARRKSRPEAACQYVIDFPTRCRSECP